MTILLDRAKSAVYEDGHVLVLMDSGVEIRFPIAGTPEQLNHVEISPYGLHWPQLDEDLSFRGLAEGNYGQTGGTKPATQRS
jgi:Protein of unknown function (DUF2442)